MTMATKKRPAIEAWRIHQEPGFWKQLAETRDAALAAKPQREPDPHDICWERPVKDTIAWCPPCGDKRLTRMALSNNVFIRDRAKQIRETYWGLCRRHQRIDCGEECNEYKNR